MKRGLWLCVLAIPSLRVHLTSARAAAMNAAKSSPFRPPMHEIRNESDPTSQESCDLMGMISIIYEDQNPGPPNFGLRITDPWGRKIGYDPRAPKVWQDLPLAEGFVECDQNEDLTKSQHCAAHIQICGPVSGTYKLEVLPTESGTYSIKVFGRSRLIPDQFAFRFTTSETGYRSEIRKRTPENLLFGYSREPGAEIKLERSDRQVATTETKQATGASHQNGP